MADPRAVQVATACAQGFDRIGMPEGQFLLAESCLYLATAPKSNSGLAYFEALRYLQEERTRDVPDHLKDASRDAEGLGHGKGYLYPHAYRDHYVPQQYLPDGMQGTYFYKPGEIGYEEVVAERLEYWRSRDGEEDLRRRIERYGEDELSQETDGTTSGDAPEAGGAE